MQKQFFMLLCEIYILKETEIQLTSWRKCILDKDENSLLGTKLNSFPDYINKLPNSKVSRDKVPETMEKGRNIIQS